MHVPRCLQAGLWNKKPTGTIALRLKVGYSGSLSGTDRLPSTPG